MYKRLMMVFIAILCSIGIASANNLSSYTKVASAVGWGLYKGSNWGKTVYIQQIDPSLVRINLNYGLKVGSGYFYKDTIVNWWNKLNFDGKLISVSNGGFFEGTTTNPVQLSYGLKVNGGIVTNGASSADGKAKRMLVIRNSAGYENVFVRDYNSYDFTSPNYPNILVGLHPDVDKNSWFHLGRTFAGVDDTDPYHPMLYIVNAQEASQGDMIDILIALDVPYDQIIMLDGSGSTQLRAGSFTLYGYNYDMRQIPQTISIHKK